jgi:hypothetical protein
MTFLSEWRALSARIRRLSKAVEPIAYRWTMGRSGSVSEAYRASTEAIARRHPEWPRDVCSRRAIVCVGYIGQQFTRWLSAPSVERRKELAARVKRRLFARVIQHVAWPHVARYDPAMCGRVAVKTRAEQV